MVCYQALRRLKKTQLLKTHIDCMCVYFQALRRLKKAPPLKTHIDCIGSQRVIRLPGFIDVHVHVREPGATHKEDWSSATAAALAGKVSQCFGRFYIMYIYP